MLNYRLAEPEDADAIGAVHVLAWQQAYANLLPAAMLARLDPAQRAAEWRRALERHRTVGLAASGGELLGFVGWGCCRDPALGRSGEVYALYVLAEAQRRGVGRALMAMAAAG